MDHLVEAIGRREDPRVVPFLRDMLAHDWDAVGYEAFTSLLRRDAPIDEEKTACLLDESSPGIVRELAWALGSTKDPEIASVLVPLLDSENEAVAERAAHALIKGRNLGGMEWYLARADDYCQDGCRLPWAINGALPWPFWPGSDDRNFEQWELFQKWWRKGNFTTWLEAERSTLERTMALLRENPERINERRFRLALTRGLESTDRVVRAKTLGVLCSYTDGDAMGFNPDLDCEVQPAKYDHWQEWRSDYSE